MKVFILGNKGMLGSYLEVYLKEHFDVVGLNRDHFDASTITESSLNKIFKDIKLADVVINCIGVIKPQIDKLGTKNTIKVNSIFPLILADLISTKGAFLYHITTDCVFSGIKGKYTETDIHDAMDVYGKTKSLGEPTNCSCIRTSIIGEEKNNKRSFIEWVKSQNNKEVNGFVNHFWNGVTCLELAKIIKELIENKISWQGVQHIFSPKDYTKYDMVGMVAKKWGLNIKVKEVESGTKCDRTLRTNHPLTRKISDFETQLEELHQFSDKFML